LHQRAHRQESRAHLTEPLYKTQTDVSVCQNVCASVIHDPYHQQGYHHLQAVCKQLLIKPLHAMTFHGAASSSSSDMAQCCFDAS